MDFDSAIRSHSDWKMKLKQYIGNPDGSIDIETLAKDNACALGQWLYGDGSKFKALPEYGMIIEAHKRFHKEAASIVRRCNSGESVSEDLALGAKSGFASASSEVVGLLMKMKTKV